MAAVGYTSGDPQKVNVVGDTMTGDLIMSGASTEIIDTYHGVTGDMMRMLTASLSTGITSGGTITINANPAMIDIEATTGWVFDYDPTGILGVTNPQLTFVNFAGQAGIVPLFTTTFYLLNSTGAVVQQATVPSLTQFRTHLFLGVSGTLGGIVQAVQNLPYLQGQTGVQLLDLMRGLGAFSLQGNLISANGINLMIDKSAGTLFARAFGLPNYLDPHTAALAAQAPVNFHYMTATAVNPALVNILDVGNYDPGGLGVVTPVGGGAFTTTIHRVFGTSVTSVNDQILVQYGQNTYASLAAAVAAIGTGNFVTNPAAAGGTLLGYIAAIRTATDLSSPTEASFTRAARFALP